MLLNARYGDFALKSESLLLDVQMLSSLSNFNLHANFNPALQVGTVISLVKQGRQLHAQASHVRRTGIHLTMESQRLVRLDWVAVARVLVHVGHLASVTWSVIALYPTVVGQTTYRTVRQET